jgi:acylphosphatase
MSCLKFIIFGQVQGVYYRKYVSQAMNKKSFKGFIKNLEDGSVETVLQNTDSLNIKDIFDILYEGSLKSIVKSVEMVECKESVEFKNLFEVRY